MYDYNLKIDEKVRHHQYQHKGRFTLLALFSPDREQFSANLTLNWSSAVCLKLTIGKRFNLVCAGATEAVSAM